LESPARVPSMSRISSLISAVFGNDIDGEG
jgi:hypothetical protein